MTIIDATGSNMNICEFYYVAYTYPTAYAAEQAWQEMDAGLKDESNVSCTLMQIVPADQWHIAAICEEEVDGNRAKKFLKKFAGVPVELPVELLSQLSKQRAADLGICLA